MSRYAETTSVGSDKSRAEIERTLSRYGATAFMYGWQGDRAVIAFEAHGRQIRFTLPMPNRQSSEFTLTPSKKWQRSDEEADRVFEQAVRQRWRALALVVKAKLEAVAAGIVTFEDEFLAHTVITSGATVSDWLQPQMDQAYAAGEMPALLPRSQHAIEAEVVG